MIGDNFKAVWECPNGHENSSQGILSHWPQEIINAASPEAYSDEPCEICQEKGFEDPIRFYDIDDPYIRGALDMLDYQEHGE